jgi:hypothetical protein
MTSPVIVHHENLVHIASKLGLFSLFFIQQSTSQSLLSWQYNLSKNVHNQIFIIRGKSIQHEIDNHFVWNWFTCNYQECGDLLNIVDQIFDQQSLLHA